MFNPDQYTEPQQGLTKDYAPALVDLTDVPARKFQVRGMWKKRFAELPDDKAIMLEYNNRQRAHQVGKLIRASARYWKMPIHIRIIHGEPAIEGTDKWLVYFWRREGECLERSGQTTI